MLKKLKEHDFRISGKIILAAALLLKIKSKHLLSSGIDNLDQLINGIQEEEAMLYE
jgi:chromatin segregation and condensation protein Rec8/ScpA/Scc1 (kleisin family)